MKARHSRFADDFKLCLLQRQRDFFGSHTYERIDQPCGKFFHFDWSDSKRPQFAA
jgi:6-phosphogluconate dehydrogenase